MPKIKNNCCKELFIIETDEIEDDNDEVNEKLEYFVL